MEEDLGCWGSQDRPRFAVACGELEREGGRDLGFPVAVPALPCSNWVNLSSCSLSIFEVFFFIVQQNAFWKAVLLSLQ